MIIIAMEVIPDLPLHLSQEQNQLVHTETHHQSLIESQDLLMKIKNQVVVITAIHMETLLQSLIEDQDLQIKTNIQMVVITVICMVNEEQSLKLIWYIIKHSFSDSCLQV